MPAHFACIGDVHGRLDRLDRVVEWLANRPMTAALMVGDFTHGPFNQPRKSITSSPMLAALDAVHRLGVPVLFVPGNHDPPDQPLPGNIDGRIETIAGLRIGGIGGAGPARFVFPYEWSEDDVRRRDIPPCDILLSHAPPARTTLDVVAGTRDHVGSEAIREIAARMSGLLVCGHIHEAVGIERVNQCLCYNTGSLGEPYGRVQVGVLEYEDTSTLITLTHYDLEAGTSWSAP
jgi:Icc-related predicted phosphoesterase